MAKVAANGNGLLTDAMRKIGDAYIQAAAAHGPVATTVADTITFQNGIIRIAASAQVPTTLTAFVVKSIAVAVSASAEVSGSAAPLCVLGLNAAAADTVKVWGSADLIAPTCAVQSNSSSTIGLDSGGSGVADAAFFCAAATGYGGTGFSPVPVTGCAPKADPYANKYTPTALSSAGINVYATCDQTKNLKISGTTTFSAAGPKTPYLFCGGLTVNAGANVTFQPGIYVIWGQMLVSSNATVNAPSGVTLYFADGGRGTGFKDGYLTIQGGGNMTLKAPTSGPLAGIAIVQPIVSTYTGGTTPAITNTITGSGTLNIEGVIYMPEAQLLITGNGNLNTGTSYFGMVADFVTLQGNGTLNIGANADPVASGMPAMVALPNPNGAPSLTN